jgi:hypothetical protein
MSETETRKNEATHVNDISIFLVDDLSNRNQDSQIKFGSLDSNSTYVMRSYEESDDRNEHRMSYFMSSRHEFRGLQKHVKEANQKGHVIYVQKTGDAK